MSLTQVIGERAITLEQPRDLKPLIEQISRAKIVMLGESSHGTHEFYEWRRIISEWLITKHGFNFIAVEGDWPPCSEINQFAMQPSRRSAREVLGAFSRWPTWMWANTEIIRMAEWLRTHNTSTTLPKPIGFYGLDVYSLFESVDAVLADLRRVNPMLARRAQVRYECFLPFARDEKAYARSLRDNPEGCQREAADNLSELLALRLEGDGGLEELLFSIQQNARVVANAEHYYRAMMHGDEDSWNVRDRHMTETLGALLNHFGPQAKGIVWAHNTHIGDYRATDMVRMGEINLGGLARERWGEDQVALVGFGTHEGSVIASRSWDGPIETMPVPASRAGSYEAAFHEVARNLRTNALFLHDLRRTRNGPLTETRGHRAVGVVYRPTRDRNGTYVPTSLARRYDAFVFIDRSTALQPLIQGYDEREIPETWPQGQ